MNIIIPYLFGFAVGMLITLYYSIKMQDNILEFQQRILLYSSAYIIFIGILEFLKLIITIYI